MTSARVIFLIRGNISKFTEWNWIIAMLTFKYLDIKNWNIVDIYHVNWRKTELFYENIYQVVRDITRDVFQAYKKENKK